MVERQRLLLSSRSLLLVLQVLALAMLRSVRGLRKHVVVVGSKSGGATRLFGYKVVFLGTPDVAARSLELLQQASSRSELFEVVAVVSQPPAPSGRNKKLTPSPVHALAESLQIPLYTPESAKDEGFLSALEALSPDLCVTAAYGNFLPKRFLAIPKFGTLNIHPSLLPKYRGAAPVQRCLENGDAVSGVSVAVTVLKMDAGPLIRQVQVPLSGEEKAPEFLLQMFETGTEALLSALPSYFAGTIDKVPQDDAQACPAAKLNVTEARVDFSSMSASAVHNRCRGFAGWPGIWTTLRVGDSNDGSVERVKIITTTVLEGKGRPNTEEAAETPPTTTVSNACELVKLVGKDGVKRDLLRVVCADGSVLGILELQPPSKKVMDARSFINGLRGAPLSWVRPEDSTD